MHLRAETNLPQFHRWIDRGVRRQLPFLYARALTRSALAIRDDQRDALHGKYTIRTPFVEKGWTINAARKADYPNVRAEVGSRDRMWILHELGGTKRPEKSGNLAIATRAARTGGAKAGRIPLSQRPKPLIAADKADVVDKKVLRTGKKAKLAHLRILFLLRPRATVRRTLGFEARAERIFGERYGRDFQAALEEAFTPAR